MRNNKNINKVPESNKFFFAEISIFKLFHNIHTTNEKK